MSDSLRDMHDVAVVGFGPSGAVAAGLLASYGLSTFVCDRSTQVYDKPRAIAVDHEILRVFQQIGVIEQVEPDVEPFTPSEYFGVDGQLIRRMTMIDPPYPLGYTPSNVFTQPIVEQKLRDRVSGMPGVTTALGWEVKRVEQDEESVELQLQDAAGVQRRIRARYLVACDGASSGIREAMGLELEDLAFDEPWLVVDVLANDRGLAKLPKTSVQYCDPERPSSFLIGPGRHRRWEISLKEGEDPQHAATPERTWELLSRWIDPADGELWRQASYRFHALVARQWRRGRVFIAGDAAHQQPPFLGQGMCQGIRDVANLSWKLRAVLRGEVAPQAVEALLDSYGIERGEHVRQLTARIKDIGAVICERDPERARARDAHLLAQGGGVVVDTPRQDVIPRLEHGLLSTGQSAARGTLFPQPWLVDGGERRRFDQLAGDGWLLVRRPGLAHGADAAAGRLKPHTLQLPEAAEPDGLLAAWFERNGCVAALVRPDRYVFGTAERIEDEEGLVREAAASYG